MFPKIIGIFFFLVLFFVCVDFSHSAENKTNIVISFDDALRKFSSSMATKKHKLIKCAFGDLFKSIECEKNEEIRFLNTATVVEILYNFAEKDMLEPIFNDVPRLVNTKLFGETKWNYKLKAITKVWRIAI